MLVLTRRVGEEIVIANNIHIKVVSIKGDRIRIGITAPENVTVDRAEVHFAARNSPKFPSRRKARRIHRWCYLDNSQGTPAHWMTPSFIDAA